MPNAYGYFAALRAKADLFKASKPEARKLQTSLLDLAKSLHKTAALIYGAPVADYFRGDSVLPSDVLKAIKSLARLTDHDAPPRARTVDAPVTTNSPLEARLARLEFRELERERKDKALALWRVLKDKTKPFEAFLFDGGDDWTIADVIRDGIRRATVIDWDNPDKAGLADLEAILRVPIGNPNTRQQCNMVSDLRARVAVLWKDFDAFAAAHCADNDELADARDARFDARRIVTLAEAMDDIEAALASTERWGDELQAYRRQLWAKRETRKLTDFRSSEFG
jgi:hypothetical protein